MPARQFLFFCFAIKISELIYENIFICFTLIDITIRQKSTYTTLRLMIPICLSISVKARLQNPCWCKKEKKTLCNESPPCHLDCYILHNRKRMWDGGKQTKLKFPFMKRLRRFLFKRHTENTPFGYGVRWRLEYMYTIYTEMPHTCLWSIF